MCRLCGRRVCGRGANNARLCDDCWIDALRTVVLLQADRVRGAISRVARTYGVAHQTLSRKLAEVAA